MKEEAKHFYLRMRLGEDFNKTITVEESPRVFTRFDHFDSPLQVAFMEYEYDAPFHIETLVVEEDPREATIVLPAANTEFVRSSRIYAKCFGKLIGETRIRLVFEAEIEVLV